MSKNKYLTLKSFFNGFLGKKYELGLYLTDSFEME